MNQMSFVCDAIYRGSEIVEGAVSPNKLTSLADLVLNAEHSVKGYAQICIDKLPRGERCQLQIDEEKLRVSTSRKDEGFESDSESSSTASGSVIEETLCTSPEIKVIEDHVLRLEKLIRQDSGIHHCTSKTSTGGGSPSMSSSSGAESEEDSPRKNDSAVISTPAKKESTSSTGSKSSFQSGNGCGDIILLSDILFCHVMTNKPKVVIIVVKSVDTSLVAAHLFECLTQEAARTLYNCYYSASNKYKLNRYRKSKRRLEGLGPEENELLDKIHVSIRNVRRNYAENVGNNQQISPLGNNKKLNRINDVDHNEKYLNSKYKNNMKGDNANVNVIEIKDTLPVKVPAGMMQRTDANGVTHIEIESAPCSLINPMQGNNNSQIITTFDSQEILSALDRLSLHSSNNPDSYLNSVGVTSSCPNSLIVTSREIGEREKERKMRQRQPPLFIKKDNFRKIESLPRREIRRREERRNRSRSEERKEEEERNQSLNMEESKLPNDNLSRVNETNFLNRIRNKDNSSNMESHSIAEQEAKNSERQSRLRSPLKFKDERTRLRSNHNKGPAPPPPRNHPNNPNPTLILVPTKSGQEKSKSYYPKETHIVRGSKLVRIDYPLYPPWNMNSDLNNNAKRMYYAHPGWISSHEYHTSRYSDRGILSVDMRKRSRSKSPARRPMAHRYIDAVSTFNFSQKLKDLSDTVIQSWKNNTQNGSPHSPFIGVKENLEKSLNKRDIKLSSMDHSKYREDALRPVIKRGRKLENNNDPRRVTFSAYATVQVMDS